MLEKLWDDVLAGPQPERGLGKLRKNVTAKPLTIVDQVSGVEKKYEKSLSMPASPSTPGTPKENVWRSVFHPGSNLATKSGAHEMYDKPSHPNSPTVYDWLYSGETRSKHHH